MRRQHHAMIGLVAMLIVLGLNSCGGAATAPPAVITRKQTIDRLTIALDGPQKPPLLDEQELLITLTDAQGRPVDGAEVWLALVMPTMQHSPNEPDAIPAGPGQYRVKALFTMIGTWNIEVHATVRGREYIARFQAPVG